jgi:hypothetical protein
MRGATVAAMRASWRTSVNEIADSFLGNVNTNWTHADNVDILPAGTLHLLHRLLHELLVLRSDERLVHDALVTRLVMRSDRQGLDERRIEVVAVDVEVLLELLEKGWGFAEHGQASCVWAEYQSEMVNLLRRPDSSSYMHTLLLLRIS